MGGRDQREGWGKGEKNPVWGQERSLEDPENGNKQHWVGGTFYKVPETLEVRDSEDSVGLALAKIPSNWGERTRSVHL